MAEKITLARPYAEAIFDLANQDNKLDIWSDNLSILSQVAVNEKVLDVINNPETSLEGKVILFTDVCTDMLDEQSVNLIKLVAGNGRLALLPEISQEYEVLKTESQGTIEAEVLSAFAVNATQKKLIIEKLEQRFDKKVTITTTIDKNLLGGIIIRAGDLVIDGSVSNQLEKITQTLMR